MWHGKFNQEMPGQGTQTRPKPSPTDKKQVIEQFPRFRELLYFQPLISNTLEKNAKKLHEVQKA
jgi:hypothetical protein